jgi:photosystem II stability/assembly factor-like uncharacterized protein
MKKILTLLLIMLSVQAGAQYWNEVSSGTQKQLFSIAFTNKQVGYIGGYDGFLLKTTNGGQTWNPLPQIALLNSFNDVIDLDFVNENIGYAIISHYQDPTYRGDVIKTTDGGLSWAPVDAGNTAAYCAHFFGDDNGMVAGSAFFAGFVTNKIPSGNPAYYHYMQVAPGWFFKAIDFRNEQTGIVAGDEGFIARTFDGGLNWDTLTCQVTDTTINAIRFLNDSIVIAACEGLGGTLLMSYDTGRTWQVDFNSVTFDYPIMRSIVKSAKDTFVAVGESTTRSGMGMVYWKDDMGNRFQIVDNALRSVAMLNDSIAYAVGDSGIIVTNRAVPVTGIDAPSLNENDFKVYPNPNSGYFNIASIQKCTVTVLDIAGKIVFEDKKPGNRHVVSLKENAGGVYLIKIIAGDKSVTKKITVER